jgi:TM2 domain-containing membrane protein YozV
MDNQDAGETLPAVANTVGNNQQISSRLSDTQKMLIEQRIANEKPSSGTAYLLCLFLGTLGAHRFYLGQTGTAVVMLILSITLFGLLISGPWAVIDLFLISGIIQKRMEALRQKYTIEALA